MKRIIVGEGSYGCVHKPSIHCTNPPKPGFDYKNYVSKIMKTKNAQQELAEFVIIKNIDPKDEYHLGEPILCKPRLDEANVKADISRCKYIKNAELDKYSLLVLKFGGHDLKAFCDKYLIKYLGKDKSKRVDKFWLEVHHLIKGLKFFKDHGIVHNDIKPQNILFDSTNGKMRYIDFGLMRKKKDIINSSEISDNYLGIYHWSYPFDCGFMNAIQYQNYKHRSAPRKTFLKNELSQLIVTDSKINTLGLPISNPASFKILFTYLNPDDTVPDAATQYGYINSFFDGFDDLITSKLYNEVLNHTADSIDVFGLGFTLQFMANCFKRLNGLSLEDYTRLSTFFHKMYDFNPVTRVIDIDLLLSEYENILLEIGILTRIRKSFENHILVNKAPAPPIIMKKTKSDEHSAPEHLSAKLQEIANNDPIDIIIRCPEGKEFNPTTKRCVKKCLPGFVRNDKFKCYSVVKKTRKKIQSVKIKSLKRCPEDTELNPLTNRCVKKCKPGFSRNSKFQCRNKTQKISSVSRSNKSKSRSNKSKGRWTVLM